MKAFYTRQFSLPLPKTHPFPIEKYSLLRQRALGERIISPDDIFEPRPASIEELLRVHQRDYVNRVLHDGLTDKEMRTIGFPWSPFLPKRSRRSCGGTIQACGAALEDGIAVNLAGGTHHAYPEHGEGYCVFNDCAVAARAVQTERPAHRIAIVDCDVHQGNGTAVIFRGDDTVFTFSVHGKYNFPFDKEESDLDIALEDKTGDDGYLDALQLGLRQTLDRAGPDLVIYIAGADPYRSDRNGRLSLTKAGLAERDSLVFDACRGRGIPVAIAMGGGYSPQIEDIVDIHTQTIQIAASRFHGA